MKTIETLSMKWQGDEARLWILDQTLLPHEEKWIEVKTPDEMIHEIKRLAVRGAPLIGVVAVLSLARYARELEMKAGFNELELRSMAKRLREARPTAVNLMNAIDRVCLNRPAGSLSARQLQEDAEAFCEDDIELCNRLAIHGAGKISNGMNILTHCNTGGLATAGVGTALGAIRKAHEQGKKIHVYVDETRPLLQGARLTAWELEKLKIPHTLICDNMAGFLMKQGKVDLVIVGADRIARNGDFANKIGTYSLAVLAHHHRIPFYTIAPKTTFDPDCTDASCIEIEQRNPDEVRAGKSPTTTPVYNPAFDSVPRALITGVIFEDSEL